MIQAQERKNNFMGLFVVTPKPGVGELPEASHQYPSDTSANNF
jgi:hypothetical protein